MAPTPRAVQVTSESLSNSTAKIRFPSPAKVTCQAVALKGSALCHFFESTEPSAQLNDPASSARDHQSSRRPIEAGVLSSGQMSTTTPELKTPASIGRRELWWSLALLAG